MTTTFFSASLAACLDVSVSIILTGLPNAVNIKFANAAVGKNEAIGAITIAATQTTGINHALMLRQIMTFLAAPFAAFLTAFFSPLGALE